LGDLVGAIVKELGLKAGLGEMGVEKEMWDTLAKNSMKDKFMETNPVPISRPEQVLEILEGRA
jgi:alcohol dehydrogenase class IV